MGDGVKAYRQLKSLQAALNNPAYHMPVNLNIKAFKRHIQENFPHLNKHERNAAIRMYKEKGWAEYAEIVKFRGSFPAHAIPPARVPGEKNGQ